MGAWLSAGRAKELGLVAEALTERDGGGLVMAASTSSVPHKCLRHLWASIYGISGSIVGRFAC
jgi:hypothetical protein